MALPTMPEFEEAYRAFVSRYAPGRRADAQATEFTEALRHLLELTARCAADAPAGPPPTVPTELGEMRRLNAGWIERIKHEEEMGGEVPWPVRTERAPWAGDG